ncbi:hypothetical protein Lal_00022675 [Lupinus albus]|nr:hypothetical protein Lal_00022675 [Lupinus albus]
MDGSSVKLQWTTQNHMVVLHVNHITKNYVFILPYGKSNLNLFVDNYFHNLTYPLKRIRIGMRSIQDNILCMLYGFNITFLSYVNVSNISYSSQRKDVLYCWKKMTHFDHVYLFVKAATIEEIEDEKASIENDVKNRMEKTIENIHSNFNSIRTDKSNPTMLDKIEVEYYGSHVNLKSIAQISTPDANSLLVQPYDKSSFSTFRLRLDSLSECDHQLSQYSKLDPIPTAKLFNFSSMFGLVERIFSTFRLCSDSLSECDHQLSQYSKLDPLPIADLFYFSSMFGLIERM